jgi:hypothetical protein
MFDAINNWPEDEANLSAGFALDLFDDDDALIERFKIKFNSITSKITGLYI